MPNFSLLTSFQAQIQRHTHISAPSVVLEGYLWVQLLQGFLDHALVFFTDIGNGILLAPIITMDFNSIDINILGQAAAKIIPTVVYEA